jgi:phospholipase/lecithinase/hemolysin
MKNLTLKALLVWLIIAVFPMTAVAADTNGKKIDQIVFFGDSLSDNGNLYYYDVGTLPKSPPYFEGRFSDGPTWAEVVASHFLLNNKIPSENYAIGGESVLKHDPSKGRWPFMLDQSLLDYFAHNFNSDKSNTLFIILIGANDYLWGSEDPDKDTTAVTNALEDNLKLLIKAGGKHFLLLNLPDLSVVPAARLGGDVKTLSKLTQLHNQKLAKLAEYLQASNTDVDVKIFDYYTTSADILAHPENYNKKYNTHISNVSDACWTGGYQLMTPKNQELKIAASLEQAYKANPEKFKLHMHTTDVADLAHAIANNPALSVAYLTAANAGDGLQPCADPDSYIFWDLVHPTSKGHMITGALVIDYIQANFMN